MNNEGNNILPQEMENYINLIQKSKDLHEIENLRLKQENAQLSSYSEAKNPNLVEFQLDLTEEKDKLEHTLSAHEIDRRPTPTGEIEEVWVEPKDIRLKTFSVYGVKLIMNLVNLYLNKDVLLSNFSEEQIQLKIYNFANELNDLIYTNFEELLYYKLPKEFYDEYYPTFYDMSLRRQTTLTYDDFVLMCIEKSNEEMVDKLKKVPLYVVAISNLVHSTLLRALNGEERESLRKQLFVSQNSQAPGLNYPQPKAGGLRSLIPKA